MSPEIIDNDEDFGDEVFAAYMTSKVFGVYSPYDYLFRLHNNYLEVDFAVVNHGLWIEEKELEKEVQ